jgi:F-type H+-transporting ATPase subunit gamma
VEQISSTIDRTPYPGHWLIIFNEENENHIEATTVQPFLEFSIEKKPVYSSPPILNVSSNELFSAFSEHYLFSLLYSIFYNSYYAESNQRLHHLDNALDRLDKQKLSLTHNINIIRQEEITEEIEVIMLSIEEIMKESDIYP